ncbi:YegS/Rv2252/BmrU family lipid kinase [Gordonia sp. X0973]|uniref:YegS/Rv2252/BmrU family lipid kinase n=1 Tax=Gordonia sp. X0973 TaxID=2742602 RepID=UPI000F5205B2|nr:YegS/Rv2252/BmrU family lipid kinase [Gordonia sp. X0973]QKT08925.1 YegS/Rv2252/BmrU family lipid kinase [Gordonia sp. X0973]
MPIRSLAILANPLARKGTGLAIAAQVEQLLHARGVRVRLVAGRDLDDARRLAEEAVADDEIDALVAVGGDGSIRLALEAAATVGSDTPVGIVPAGTGNDLARTLGIPHKNLPRAVDIIAAGHSRALDLGRVRMDSGETVLFVTVAATGFDADVTIRANQMRWPRGQARYLVAAIREISKLRVRHFTVSVDGRGVVDGDVLFAAIGNTTSYGGGMLITPDADVHDGLLDVTIATKSPEVGRGTLLRLMPTVFKGTHVHHPLVRTARGATVRVESDPPAFISVDGDIVGKLPATFDTLPGAAHVLLPG